MFTCKGSRPCNLPRFRTLPRNHVSDVVEEAEPGEVVEHPTTDLEPSPDDPPAQPANDVATAEQPDEETTTDTSAFALDDEQEELLMDRRTIVDRRVSRRRRTENRDDIYSYN